MEGEKKERPQNRNLKPLGSSMLSEEEEFEIRKKGGIASGKKRKKNADIRAAVRAIANLNVNGSKKSVDVEKMVSLDQLDEDGAPMIARMVYAQFLCAVNGDKESRNWICNMLGVRPDEDGGQSGLTVTADADAIEAAGGVRVHLIRGDKPAEPEQETPEKSYEDRVLDELEKKPTNGEKAEPENHTAARTEVSPERMDGVPSEPKSEAEPSAPSHRENGEPEFRPSVKKKIRQMEERKRTARTEQKTAEIPVPDATKTVPVKPKER